MSLRSLGFAGAAFAALISTGLAAQAADTSSDKTKPSATAEVLTPSRQSWTFSGPFGTFDQAQLQRGFQVYREVCSTCHSIKDLAFRNLADPGGPAFTEGQVKALAAQYKIKDGPNTAGDMFERPGRPGDYFPPPFPNDEAAAANFGKAPPDMSVLAKARTYEEGFPWFLVDAVTQYQEQGPDYIYAILNGFTHSDDVNWNAYFPGHHIAMPKPLSDGQVEYTDGSPKTVPQYAKDVASFLMWVAEPTLEERKRDGFRVMIFLIVFAGLLYFVKKRIWSRVHDGDVVIGTH